MAKVYDEFLRQHRMMEDIAKQLKPFSLFDEVQRHSGIIKMVREQEDLLGAAARIGRMHWEQERAVSQLMRVVNPGNYEGAIAKAHRELGTEISRFLEPHKQLNDATSELSRRLDEETKRVFAPLSSDSLSYAAAKAAALIEPHKRFSDSLAWQDSLASRMARMEFAWAAPDFIDKSAYAFGSLARLNDTISFDRPFSSQTREHVESKLGSLIEIAKDDDIEDLEKRYDEAGRDVSLVAFPDTEYSTILRAVGFDFAIPVPLTPQPIANATGPARYVDEHHIILRNLEVHLRLFISRELRRHAGPQWVKQRVPEMQRLNWERRQAEARAAGEPIYELVHYADFMDLAVIIGTRNNWNEVFKAVFQDKEGVQVSLKRLAPLRNANAHNRPFCPTQMLCLAAESVRLLKSIGVLKV